MKKNVIRELEKDISDIKMSYRKPVMTNKWR